MDTREQIAQEARTLLFENGVIAYIEVISSNFADQILAIKVEEDRECPCVKSKVTKWCGLCNQTGKLSGRTLKQVLEGLE